VIGDDYQCALCTDRGRSYDAKELLDIKRRKRIGDIRRSIGEVLKNKRGPALRFRRELKGRLKEAVSLYHSFHNPTMKLPNYEKMVRELDLRIICHLRNRVLKDLDDQRLLNEIGVHHDRGDLLRFIYEPTTVEPINTAAEPGAS